MELKGTEGREFVSLLEDDNNNKRIVRFALWLASNL